MDGWIKGVVTWTKETRPTRPLSIPLGVQSTRTYTTDPPTTIGGTRSSHWQLWSTASPFRQTQTEDTWRTLSVGIEPRTFGSQDRRLHNSAKVLALTNYHYRSFEFRRNCRFYPDTSKIIVWILSCQSRMAATTDANPRGKGGGTKLTQWSNKKNEWEKSCSKFSHGVS